MNINIKVFYKLITSFLLAVARHVQSTQNNNVANSLQYLEKERKDEVDFLHADKHIKKDNKSCIFKHLQSSATCFDSHNSLCSKIIDKANSKFDLKINEALRINWRKPNLNAQQNHLALIFSLQLLFPLLLSAFIFLLLFFVFLFHLLFSLSLR